MAALQNRKPDINSRVVIIGDGGDPEVFSLVVCLTSNQFDIAVNDVVGESKCGTDHAPGTASTTLQIAGLVIVDPYNGNISIAELFRLASTKQLFNFKYGPLNPVTGDVIYTGRGFFSAYNETDATNTYATFSGTIQLTENGLTETVTP